VYYYTFDGGRVSKRKRPAGEVGKVIGKNLPSQREIIVPPFTDGSPEEQCCHIQLGAFHPEIDKFSENFIVRTLS
jgi:hypothetical protein